MQFQGKTAIVTGAGSGIGEGIAKAFARAGANVCVADIDTQAMERVVQEIEAAGGSVELIG